MVSNSPDDGCVSPRARTTERTSDRVEMFAAARRRGSRGWTKCVAVFAIGALFASANYGVTKGTTRRDATRHLFLNLRLSLDRRVRRD
jgi:hypothetical protein